MNKQLDTKLYKGLTRLISETNGLSLNSTLELFEKKLTLDGQTQTLAIIHGFRELLGLFHSGQIDETTLLNHAVSRALYKFFKDFPVKYMEDHIHLTGSLTADFVTDYLQPLLNGNNKSSYQAQIKSVYGVDVESNLSKSTVDELIRLKENQGFDEYLKILYLPKLILTSREMHRKAALHLATSLYENHNVGSVRLKFTLNRQTSDSLESIPGIDALTEEDVILGLYEGFNEFKNQHRDFYFILSPCFRKESSFFDSRKFKSKGDHFLHSVEQILELRKKYPELRDCLSEVDTVGNEKNLHRKAHFAEMKNGFQKLQNHGFSIRSHHGETWDSLRKGIQSVDNAMNIWRLDVIEHGLSLGINPNYYYHELLQTTLSKNEKGIAIARNSLEGRELLDMDWSRNDDVIEKIFAGTRLSSKDEQTFTKVKFHLAREVENYQHDILNRMISKQISLTTLPSSNKRLTGNFKTYKDHPFSWWEKKGVALNIGTDNYVTLDTDYIREMLIMLFTDPDDLKITKLLMVTTGETRRPYLSQLLWEMRQKII